MIRNPFRTNRCPHTNKRGIYGDEINHSAGYRLACQDCGTLLDGPVSLATGKGRAYLVVEFKTTGGWMHERMFLDTPENREQAQDMADAFSAEGLPGRVIRYAEGDVIA